MLHGLICLHKVLCQHTLKLRPKKDYTGGGESRNSEINNKQAQLCVIIISGLLNLFNFITVALLKFAIQASDQMLWLKYSLAFSCDWMVLVKSKIVIFFQVYYQELAFKVLFKVLKSCKKLSRCSSPWNHLSTWSSTGGRIKANTVHSYHVGLSITEGLLTAHSATAGSGS